MAPFFGSSGRSAPAISLDDIGAGAPAGSTVDLDDLGQDRAWAAQQSRCEATRDAHVCSTKPFDCVRTAIAALDDAAAVTDENVGGYDGYMGRGAAQLLAGMYEKVVVAKPDDPVAFLLADLGATE